VVVVGLVALGHSARAQSPRMSPAARAHFDKGVRYYSIQLYGDAIEEFKAGYEIDPRPDFLYALGQAQRMNKDCRGAIVSYEAFLRTGPKPSQAAPAAAQIEACRSEIAANADGLAPMQGADGGALSAPPAPPPPPPPPTSAPSAPTPQADPMATPMLPEDRAGPAVAPTPAGAPATQVAVVQPDESPPLYRRWWFWALIGGAVATALGVAAATGAFTHEADAPCPPDRECLTP